MVPAVTQVQPEKRNICTDREKAVRCLFHSTGTHAGKMNAFKRLFGTNNEILFFSLNFKAEKQVGGTSLTDILGMQLLISKATYKEFNNKISFSPYTTNNNKL